MVRTDEGGCCLEVCLYSKIHSPVESVANRSRSAFNSWNKNGQKNGWNSKAEIDWSNEDDYNTFANGELTDTYGVVNIPVCSITEIAETVADDLTNEGGNPYFPCPPPEDG